MQERLFTIYILANERNTVVYVGVTGRFPGRVWKHKEKLVAGFTQRYNATKLVYYETTENPTAAIAREKENKSMAPGKEKSPHQLHESRVA